MSFETRVTPTMIDRLEINKQHYYFSSRYACKITLSDGRERSVNIEGASLYSLTSVIAQNKIVTSMDYDNLKISLREAHIYGTFADSDEVLLSKIFTDMSQKNCCLIL